MSGSATAGSSCCEPNRPVTAADEALFVERTIEAVERKEQVVVSKDARVVEEIGVRRMRWSASRP